MRGLPILCLVLFACDNAIGIEIRVGSLTAVDTVDLYLGVGNSCLAPDSRVHELCDGIAPPRPIPYAADRGPLAAEVYRVDQNEVFSSPVSGGSAWFRIEPESKTLPAVIAVGTGGNQLGTVILDDIALGEGAIHYRAELLPAGTTLTETEKPSGTNVERWDPPAGTSKAYRCVGAEVRDATRNVTRRVFIVPEEDPDCDAVIGECRRFTHLAKDIPGAVAVDEVECTSQQPLGGQAHCLLGGKACDEFTTDLRGCKNEEVICASDLLCASCPDLDDACVKSVYATSAATFPSHILCQLEFRDMGGALQLCTSEALAFPTLSRSLGGTCPTTANIGPVGFPFGFAKSLTFPFPTGETLAFTVSDPVDAACLMGVDWTGTIPPGPDRPENLMALIHLEVDPTRALVVPMMIVPKIVPVCGETDTNRCDVVRFADPVFDCVPP